MGGAYYNDSDPFVCAWLRELIKAGLIAPGEVDERSIEEVKPDDLRGFTQCHFFAGVGVWSHALRNAGWADDTPVWTGSCPCQSFSASGQRGGFSDKRHLWPAWFRLIRERRPNTVFGEQVSSKDGLAWFDVVSSQMEDEGYAIGALDTSAAGVGAPHIRQRLYFVADSLPAGRAEGRAIAGSGSFTRCGIACDSEHAAALGLPQRTGEAAFEPEGTSSRQAQQRSGNAVHGSDANNIGRQQLAAEEPGKRTSAGERRIEFSHDRVSGRRSDSDGGDSSTEGLQRGGQHGLCAEDSQPGDYGNPEIIGRVRRANNGHTGRRELALGQASEAGDSLNTEQQGLEGHAGNVREWRGPGWLDPDTARSVAEAGATRGFWRDCDWWYGRDGKYRPIGAGLFPLVAGATGRMGKLRGYGNALCAPQAKEFIEAYMSLQR